MINSIRPAADAFLGIWNSVPSPVVALAYTVLFLAFVRMVIEVVGK